jgi:hypothetical protein
MATACLLKAVGWCSHTWRGGGRGRGGREVAAEAGAVSTHSQALQQDNARCSATPYISLVQGPHPVLLTLKCPSKQWLSHPTPHAPAPSHLALPQTRFCKPGSCPRSPMPLHAQPPCPPASAPPVGAG